MMSGLQANQATYVRRRVFPRATQILVALPLVAGLAPTAEESVTEPPAEKAIRTAEKLFEEEHWAEARAAYDQARDRELDWESPWVRPAVEGSVAAR